MRGKKSKCPVFSAKKNTVFLLCCAASRRDSMQLILRTEGKHFCSFCTEKLSFKGAAFKRGLEGRNQMKERSGLTEVLKLQCGLYFNNRK